MNKKIKTGISKGALGLAVGTGPVVACIGLYNAYTNDPTSELFMYTCMGTFWLCVFLHLFFRDENFDKLQFIDKTIWILLPWLAILFLYAFMLGAYLAMFVSLGFLIVIYLIHLLLGVLKLEKEDIS